MSTKTLAVIFVSVIMVALVALATRYPENLLIAPSVVILASVPLILRLVAPNPVYGFRTSHTQSSPAIWYKANRVAGVAMLIAGLVWLAAAIGFPRVLASPGDVPFWVTVVGVGSAVTAAVVSYVLCWRIAG